MNVNALKKVFSAGNTMYIAILCIIIGMFMKNKPIIIHIEYMYHFSQFFLLCTVYTYKVNDSINYYLKSGLITYVPTTFPLL